MKRSLPPVEPILGLAPPTELLKALHLLTPDGNLNQDARRKLKQVSHFLGVISQHMGDVLSDSKRQTVVELGSGKSYLSLLLFSQVIKDNFQGVKIECVEAREDLCSTTNELIRALGYSNQVSVRHNRIEDLSEEYSLRQNLAAVLALHACDTATDSSLALGVQAQARLIALAPCCQAELAASAKLLLGSKLEDLLAHGLHRREFGALATNAIRALLLEAHGYKVRVTEFTLSEHSPKNELILGVKHQKTNPVAARRLNRLCEALGLMPDHLPAKLKSVWPLPEAAPLTGVE